MAIQQLLEPRRNSLADTFILAQNLKSARSQNALAARKVQEYEREERVREELARAYAGGADPSTEEGFRSLAAIDPESALEARKTGLEGERAEVDLETAQLESQFKRAERGAQILSGVRDEGSWQWAKKRAAAEGLPTEDLPENYDPAFIEQRMSEGMRVKDQIAARLAQKKQEDLQGYRQELLGIQRGQLGVSEARAAEAQRYNEARLAQDESQFQRRPPSGFSMGYDEQGRPIISTGGGLPKLTESQGKATALGLRGQEATDQLSAIEGAGYRPGIITQAQQAAGGVLGSKNRFLSEEGQRYEQAGLNFGTAIGRFESGAAIPEQEWDRFVQQYMAQPGDTDEVIAQKRRNRETAIRGVGVAAGPGRGAGGAGQAIDGGSARQRAIEALRAKGIPGY